MLVIGPLPALTIMLAVILCPWSGLVPVKLGGATRLVKVGPVSCYFGAPALTLEIMFASLVLMET